MPLSLVKLLNVLIFHAKQHIVVMVERVITSMTITASKVAWTTSFVTVNHTAPVVCAYTMFHRHVTTTMAAPLISATPLLIIAKTLPTSASLVC